MGQMTIFEGTYPDGTGIFSGRVGKDSPYGKATGLYNPTIVGPGGRLRSIIKGAQRFGRFVYQNRYPLTRGTAIVGAGAGVAGLNGRNATQSTYSKASRSGKFVNRYGRKQSKRNADRCCCCSRQEHKFRGRRR